MTEALACLERGVAADRLLEFSELRDLVGFDAYDAALARADEED